MDDLVSKYFQQDLTEAEDKALSDSLFTNDEESLRFAQLAEAAYARFGLPDPEWPGDPNDYPKPKSGWGIGMWIVLLLLTLGGAAYEGHAAHLDERLISLVKSWTLRSQGNLSLPGGAKGSGSVAEVSKIAPVKKPVISTEEEPSVEEPQKGSKEDTSTLSEKTGVAGKAQPAPVVKSPVESSAMLAPINMEKNPHRAYSDLAVAVRRHTPGEVTVTVQAMDGTPMALLYNGHLDIGRWVFDWNGRLPEGEPVPPGHYRVMVESGGVTQVKSIVIRNKKASPGGSSGK